MDLYSLYFLACQVIVIVDDSGLCRLCPLLYAWRLSRAIHSLFVCDSIFRSVSPWCSLVSSLVWWNCCVTRSTCTRLWVYPVSCLVVRSNWQLAIKLDRTALYYIKDTPVLPVLSFCCYSSLFFFFYNYIILFSPFSRKPNNEKAYLVSEVVTKRTETYPKSQSIYIQRFLFITHLSYTDLTLVNRNRLTESVFF